jgi:uncharacterized protein (TIGR02271 family)
VITIDQAQAVLGQPVYGADGDKIGRLGHIYVDDATGSPEWITVETGLFGIRESFVPVASAEVTDDGVTVPFTKDQVKDAPSVSPTDEGLSDDDEAELYRHFGLEYGSPPVAYNSAYESDRSYRTDGAVDDAMTRSEERLDVGTETVEAGRARLRKYVVTEQQTVSVPVTREEVRLEREPITDANRANSLDGPEITEAEHEVILHEERPVVATEAVPVERIRLATETVTENEQVTGEVRKEQIVTDGDAEVRDSDLTR